jgi:LysM repeat protein
MSRIQRVLFGAAVSAISLSTVSLAAPAFAAPANPATGTTYVVVAGDFLAGIAAKVGVSLPQLLTANNLTTKSVILPGNKLIVPAGATTPTPAPAPTSPTTGSLVHTVKSGEFLGSIANLHKVTLADLLAVNNLTVKSLILPGQQLALPGNAVAAPNDAAATPSAPASALTHTVKSGDFLAGIAKLYKVSLPDLLALNKLTARSLILPGAKLALPPGAVLPVATSTAAVIEAAPGPLGAVVAFAYAQLGKPYRFFTAGPNTFDCSGLTMAAYAQVGIPLVHHSASQATMGTTVDIWNEPIKAGDLIFMATHGNPNEITHVGIAVDATHWIHAPKPGDVVRLAPIPPKGILSSVKRLVP